MKQMNFSFIFTLIFMMGSLALIHAEPYAKVNSEKPFLYKTRRLSAKCDNCIRIIYGSTTTFQYKGTDSPTITKDGTDTVNGEIEVTDGTKIDIEYTSVQNDLEDFFQSKIGNYDKIKLIDLSNFNSDTQSLKGLLSGC